jgi:hypothetical protein
VTDGPITVDLASERSATWLVVGHGSVGSTLVQKLLACGESAIFILDPDPRIPVLNSEQLLDSVRLDSAVRYVMSCVPASVAPTVPALVREVVNSDSLLFDWNSVSPAAKR